MQPDACNNRGIFETQAQATTLWHSNYHIAIQPCSRHVQLVCYDREDITPAATTHQDHSHYTPPHPQQAPLTLRFWRRNNPDISASTAMKSAP